MNPFNNTNNSGVLPSLFGNPTNKTAGSGSLFNNNPNAATTPNSGLFQIAPKISATPPLFSFGGAGATDNKPINAPNVTSLFGNNTVLNPNKKQDTKGDSVPKPLPLLFGNSQTLKGDTNITTGTNDSIVPPSGANFSFFGGKNQNNEIKSSVSPAMSLFGQKFAKTNEGQNKVTASNQNPQKSLFGAQTAQKKDDKPAEKLPTFGGSLLSKLADNKDQKKDTKQQPKSSLFGKSATTGSSLFPQFQTKKDEKKQVLAAPKDNQGLKTSLFSKPAAGENKLIQSKPTQNKSLFMNFNTPQKPTPPIQTIKPAQTKPQQTQAATLSINEPPLSLFAQKSNIATSQNQKPKSLLQNKDKPNQNPSSLFSNFNSNTLNQAADPKLLTHSISFSTIQPPAPESQQAKPSNLRKLSTDRKPSIQIQGSDLNSSVSPSILNSKKSQIEDKQKATVAGQSKPKVTFSLNQGDTGLMSLGKKTLVVDSIPIKSNNKVTDVQQSNLVDKKVFQQQFTSCKEVMKKISQSQYNKQQLKQFITQKRVRDILTLTDNPSFVLNGQNFSISQIAMPNYTQTHINLKRYVFDLICYFKSITKYSDWKCLNIVENFFSETKYYDEFRLNSLTPDQNYFHSKKVYEIGIDDNVILSTFSSQVKTIMQMLIDQQLIMLSYVCQSVLIIDKSFTRGQISKIFNKQQFIAKYFGLYFKYLNKLKSQSSKEDISVYFRSKLRHQVLMFSNFILNFISKSQISETITQPLLKQIITQIDSYSQYNSVIDSITNNRSNIEKNHQYILLRLINFDRIKKGQNSVLDKYPTVIQTIKNTKSDTLLPFRQIMNYIKSKQEQQTKDTSSDRVSIRSNYQCILADIDGHEWMDWVELYLRDHRVSNKEYQTIANVMDRVYCNSQSLIQLFRLNKFQERVHPIYKHLEHLKKNRNHRILYRIYKLLLGNEEFNQSQKVVQNHIRDKQWSEYLFKPMLTKFKEAAYNQTVLTEDSDDTNSKAAFLFKIIQLNPSNLEFYSHKIFKNKGFPLQLIIFLLDCLNYYTINASRNYKMASNIFRTLNKLLANQSTYKDLLFGVSLYHSMNSVDTKTHWLLKFISELKRDSSLQAGKLKKLIAEHLQILLNHQQILLIAPEYSEINYQIFIQAFKQRYSGKQLWQNINKDKVPGSPWIRSISTILDDKLLNYRAIGNILRLVSFKSTQSYSNDVPYLNLIKNILNQLPIAQNLFQLIQKSALQSLHILNKRKQMYEILRANSQKTTSMIQDGLYLLHILLDLLYGVFKMYEQTKYPNYYINFINDLKCLQGVESTLGSYFNTTHEQKYTHPFVNLFGFINYQKQRLLQLWNNPSLSKQHYLPSSVSSTLNNKKQRDSLDYNYLINPLLSPLSKQYTSIQSISINTLKVLTATLKIHKTKINLNQYFKRSVGTGILQTVLNLIYQSLINFQSMRQQCILTLQFLYYASKYQYKFVESFLISSNSFFTFLDAFLKSPTTNISILQKSIQLINSIVKSSFRKTINDKLKQRDYKQLFLNKLKEFDTNKVKRIQNINIQNNTQQILDRITVNRSILDHARYYHSTQLLIQMTFISIFKGQKPIQYIQTLFSFIIDKGLLSTVNEWRLIYSNQINRVSENTLSYLYYSTNNYLQFNNIFNNMGNYRQDPYQTHLLNSVYEQQSIYKHMQSYSNNIYSFMKDMTLSCFRSIYDILIFILNCGDEGYFMSNQPSQIKSSNISSQLYCQFHQPKIQFSIKDIYGRNQSKIYNFLQSIVKNLITDLNKINPKCNYKLCLQLLSTYIHTLRSNPQINHNFKYSLEQLIEKPTWVSDVQNINNQENINKVIVNPLVSKIVLEIITLIKQRNITISNKAMKNLSQLVSRSLINKNLIPQTKTNLLMILLNLVSLKLPLNINFIDLLSDQNSVYFYSVMRILIEYSKTHSLELVQSGIINILIHHPILSLINQELVFYNNNTRSESQMSWIWTLNLIHHITFHGGNNLFVGNQVIKFIQYFNMRILCILDQPSLQQFVPNYAYIEQLQSTLKLLNVCFRTLKNMSLYAKHLLQRFQYCLLHNTIKIFNLLQSTQSIQTFTGSEHKIKDIVPLKQLSKSSSSPSSSVFSLTLQQMLINCLSSYSSILQMSLSNSQFVKYYFQKTIQGSNIVYTNYFWLFSNKNIYHLEQLIQSLYKSMKQSKTNLLDSIQKIWKSPQIFSSNGYLTSIKVFPTLNILLDNILKTCIILSRMSLIYHKQQSMYRQKYLSLVPQDIEDFRSQQVKFIKNIQINIPKRDDKYFRILQQLKQQFTDLVSNQLVYL